MRIYILIYLFIGRFLCDSVDERIAYLLFGILFLIATWIDENNRNS